MLHALSSWAEQALSKFLPRTAFLLKTVGLLASPLPNIVIQYSTAGLGEAKITSFTTKCQPIITITGLV